MDYELVLSPRAEYEIDDAMDWYSGKTVGLEARFISILKQHFKYIQKNPFGFPAKEYNFRECTVLIFPFIVLYRIENDQIIIHSVFNTYQNPTK